MYLSYFLFWLEAVTSIKLGRDDQCYLASISDSAIKLIDGPTGKLLNSFTGHQQRKYRIESTFSEDEAHVLSGSEDAKVYVWDLVSGEIVKVLEGHTSAVTSLSQHPKNQMLLSGSADGTIKLWE